MDKQELLIKYNNEDKLLISKLLDKINETKRQNKITVTDFLNLYEQKILQEILNKLKVNNYKLYGVCEQAERKVIIIYPEKLEEVFENHLPNIENFINIIRIKLPNEDKGKFVHKNYLGSLMKLGIKREKIGDILVDENGADIIAKQDISNYLLNSLKELKRFSKSEISLVKLENIRKPNIQKEEFKILVSSLRLDSIVSELAKCSRTKSNEIIINQRVYLNFIIETKNSKEIKTKDIITIRGKGRFEIKQILGTSKKGKQIILIEKFK